METTEKGSIFIGIEKGRITWVNYEKNNGWAVLEEPVPLHTGGEEFPTVTISGRRLQFSHAPLSEISRQRLAGVEALQGYLLIRIVRVKNG